MASSPGCWAAFGEVLAREYTEPALMDIHRLTVDAYAAQHPGVPSPQSMKSVGHHLLRLCFTVERGFAVAESNRVMVAATAIKDTFGWLNPPASLGAVTVADVLGATGAEAHREAVRAWARSVWKAWAPHHETVLTWADRLRIP